MTRTRLRYILLAAVVVCFALTVATTDSTLTAAATGVALGYVLAGFLRTPQEDS